MRGLAVLLILMMLVPVAVAGPGHSGGVQEIPRLFPLTVSLEGTEVKGGAVVAPVNEVAGLVVFSGFNRGGLTVHVDLFVEETVVTTWRVPADGATHVLSHMLTEAGNISLDFRAPDAPEGATTRIDFFVDYAGDCDGIDAYSCITKLLPWEVPNGAMVFPVKADAAGTYRATVVQPPVHTLALTVRDASGQQVIASGATVNGDDTLSIEWNAEAGRLYHVFATSTQYDRAAFFNEKHQPDPETTRVSMVSEGPLVKATPALPLATVALALALLVARKRAN